jgi:hypothetical protein
MPIQRAATLRVASKNEERMRSGARDALFSRPLSISKLRISERVEFGEVHHGIYQIG